jgi:tetratricopeptide (TPR) repeat protein
MNRVARCGAGRVWRCGIVAALASAALFAGGSRPAKAQPPLKPEEMATLVLNSANRAYDDKQFAVAVERYREYLKNFSGMKDATSARFGLSLSLLESPQKDYRAAIETLGPVAGVADFPDRPLALYYLALAYRGVGHEALSLAAAKPQEAATHRNTANQNFTQAAKFFADARTAFEQRAKSPPATTPAAAPAEASELPPDVEWAARARCDEAEMQIRLDKTKEAQQLTEAFAADPALAKSRYRATGLYYHGQACFTLRDYLAAGRSLSQLVPFDDPVFGVHAQYLLARTHHLAEERVEATALYEAVLAGYDRQKAAAQQALQNVAALQDNPEEKLRLESFVKEPPPYVSRASFYWGVLLYESQRYADALARFTTFPQQYPQSPLVADAQLRQGLCQVELKQYAEALKTLQPLVQHPLLADQALLWSARSQVGLADLSQPQPYAQALNAAIDRLKQAADRANQRIAQDPDAKLRRAEILVELGDTQQLAQQFAPAATTYQQAISENYAPDRGEELLQRLATALHLAGQYDPSDQACERFKQTFPKSTLLPAVLFRSAENAYVRAAAIEPMNPASKNADLLRWFGESIKRYEMLLENYPEFVYVPLARYRLGLAHYRLGNDEQALASFSQIAQADRQGALAAVPYHEADCLIRTTPTDAADALSAARLLQQLGEAAKRLEIFVGAQPNSPETPDALLKLGYCYQHIATQIADQNERGQTLTKSRQSYEKMTQQFGNHPLIPLAVFERAKCLNAQGDTGGAMNEFNRFRTAPLNAASVAPLAWLRASTILRSQNKSTEAADLLAQCRAQYEAALLNDPARAAWAPLIQYHHAVAVKETGKLPEARALFENLVQRFATSPEAPEAAWRIGQCRKDETLPRLTASRATLSRTDAKPDERTAAVQQLADSVKSLTEIGQYFQTQAAAVAQKSPGTDTQLRMLYEAAWCYQAVADVEIEAARQKLADEALKKIQDELAKQGAGPSGVPQQRVPEIAVTAIPIQPAEQLARDQYNAMLTAASDSPLCVSARLELAELHARRDEHDEALSLLLDALDQEPAPEMEERIRLRLGVCLVAKDDVDGAFEQLAAVAANEKSPSAAEARYRAGECLMHGKDWNKAIEMWKPFRDQQPYQNVPGLSDRVLLRLGTAYALAAQWDGSRQTLETLVSRFPQSTWRSEARYGIGWAWQNQKQYDQAATAYSQVINETAAEVAAKSQFQLALCRREQKRLPEAANALLVVPLTYDYPQWNALALLEASRVYQEMQQPQQATRLLERVLKDFPDTEWAKSAQQVLTELQTGKK